MSTVAIQRPLVIACSRDSRMLAFSTTHRSTEGGFCFVAVYQRVRAGKLALGELELGIAHFQLGPDADLLPGAGEAEVLSCGLHALCGDARLLPELRGFLDGERVCGIDRDDDSQVLARELDASLLAKAIDLVIVAIRAGGVDVCLRGAAALEQALREVRLIARADRGIPENLQL